jgi:hypothetical protein
LKGETDAVQLAELGDDLLQSSQQQLADALRGSPEPSHLALWKLPRERLQLRGIEPLTRMSAMARCREKGSPFQKVFRRFLPQTGIPRGPLVSCHRLARLVWKILRTSYIEQGQEANPQARKCRAQKPAQALWQLEYRVTLAELPPALQPKASA